MREGTLYLTLHMEEETVCFTPHMEVCYTSHLIKERSLYLTPHMMVVICPLHPMGGDTVLHTTHKGTLYLTLHMREGTLYLTLCLC